MPGNIRELRNFVERAALLSSGERLETRHLAPPSLVILTLRVQKPPGWSIALYRAWTPKCL